MSHYSRLDKNVPTRIANSLRIKKYTFSETSAVYSVRNIKENAEGMLGKGMTITVNDYYTPRFLCLAYLDLNLQIHGLETMLDRITKIFTMK